MAVQIKSLKFFHLSCTGFIRYNGDEKLMQVKIKAGQ
jgi:hypothetical protein